MKDRDYEAEKEKQLILEDRLCFFDHIYVVPLSLALTLVSLRSLLISLSSHAPFVMIVHLKNSSCVGIDSIVLRC